MKKKQVVPASRQRNPFPLILIGAGLLFLVSAAIWLLKTSTPAPTTTANTQTQSDIPYPDIARVALADAKLSFDQQSAIFVDVRDSVSFGTGHIPGSVNIPVAEISTRASELDQNALIITYCT